ncbi:uncharacterized protein [Struthio camelus]|uniref:uncharacterized protein isoform X2 n=1 Tax=Struthio camelus TaxID=8801 RepID=UPI0036041D90
MSLGYVTILLKASLCRGGSGLRGRRGRAALGRQPAPKHLCRRRQRQRRGCSILEAGAGGSACSPGRRQPGEAFGVLGRRAATHRDARKDWRGGRGPAGDKRMGAGLKGRCRAFGTERAAGLGETNALPEGRERGKAAVSATGGKAGLHPGDWTRAYPRAWRGTETRLNMLCSLPGRLGRRLGAGSGGCCAGWHVRGAKTLPSAPRNHLPAQEKLVIVTEHLTKVSVDEGDKHETIFLMLFLASAVCLRAGCLLQFAVNLQALLSDIAAASARHMPPAWCRVCRAEQARLASCSPSGAKAEGKGHTWDDRTSEGWERGARRGGKGWLPGRLAAAGASGASVASRRRQRGWAGGGLESGGCPFPRCGQKEGPESGAAGPAEQTSAELPGGSALSAGRENKRSSSGQRSEHLSSRGKELESCFLAKPPWPACACRRRGRDPAPGGTAGPGPAPASRGRARALGLSAQVRHALGSVAVSLSLSAFIFKLCGLNL